MKRIIDVNLNRATEALRIIEEIARFYLDNLVMTEKLKNIRHNLSKIIDENYESLLKERNTRNDVGINIENPTKKKDIFDIYKANFKRLEQSLRVLSEYSLLDGLSIELFEKARYESYTLEKDMFEELSVKLRKFKLENKKLYLVTDRSKFSSIDEFLDNIASALKGGVQIVQLREKTANAREVVEIAKKVKELCHLYDVVFIINDRVDIAKIIGADGVHLGQDDIDINQAREILGENVIIGLSTHHQEQALQAVELGADYIGVGPVFETPTKPGRKSVGIEYVEWAAKNINIPWFAIGGIDTENAKTVIEAGAKRIAVVRAIINAESPEKASKLFLEKLEDSTTL